MEREQFDDPETGNYFSYELDKVSSLYYSYKKIVSETKTCKNGFFNSEKFQKLSGSDKEESFSPEALELMRFLKA